MSNDNRYSRHWRKSNPERNRQHQIQYYSKSKSADFRSNTPWTIAEIRLITDPDRPSDSVLAEKLGRTIRAIQIQRSRHRSQHHPSTPIIPRAPAVWQEPLTLADAIERYNLARAIVISIETALKTSNSRYLCEQLSKWQEEQQRLFRAAFRLKPPGGDSS